MSDNGAGSLAERVGKVERRITDGVKLSATAAASNAASTMFVHTPDTSGLVSNPTLGSGSLSVGGTFVGGPILGGNGSGWSHIPMTQGVFVTPPEEEEEELLASEPPRRFSWRLMKKDDELVLELTVNNETVEFKGRELMGFAASMDKFVTRIMEEVAE